MNSGPEIWGSASFSEMILSRSWCSDGGVGDEEGGMWEGTRCGLFPLIGVEVRVMTEGRFEEVIRAFASSSLNELCLARIRSRG